MPNTWEKKYHLNVNSAKDAKKDLDDDGLTNREEFKYHTNPRREDTDRDTMDDGFEVENGLNPNLRSDGARDNDGDSVSNAKEYYDGTDINDATNFDECSLADQSGVDQSFCDSSDDTFDDSDF